MKETNISDTEKEMQKAQQELEQQASVVHQTQDVDYVGIPCHPTIKKYIQNNLENTYGVECPKLLVAYADLLNMFAFIKEHNTFLSDRSQALFDMFPTIVEIEYVQTFLDEIYPEQEERDKRAVQLAKFMTVVKQIEKNNELIRPPTFDDAVEVK